jgi:hypothetical protein
MNHASIERHRAARHLLIIERLQVRANIARIYMDMSEVSLFIRDRDRYLDCALRALNSMNGLLVQSPTRGHELDTVLRDQFSLYKRHEHNCSSLT